MTQESTTPPSRGTTKGTALQNAAQARRGFAGVATSMAADLVGRPVARHRCSQVVTRQAELFSAPGHLVAVVASDQGPGTLATALGHGLAHQGDDLLSLLVPAGDEVHTAHRLASIQTPVRLLTHDRWGALTPVVVPCTHEVTEHYAALSASTTEPLRLMVEQDRWLEPVLRLPALEGAVRSERPGAVSFKLAGSNVLTVRCAKGVRLNVWTKASGRPSATLAAVATDEQVDDIDRSLAQLAAGTASNPEHQWQHALGAEGSALGTTLGLTRWHREHRVARADGMGGWIDFLGIDERDELHVVETKIGGDAQIVLQVIDYVAFVRAHEDGIRSAMRWAARPPGARLHVDILAASKVRNSVVTSPALDQYFASQLEAVRGDLPVRVWIADDVTGAPNSLRPLRGTETFEAGAHVAAALHGPRWAGRVHRAVVGRGF